MFERPVLYFTQFCLSPRLLNQPKKGIITIYDSAYQTLQGVTLLQAKGRPRLHFHLPEAALKGPAFLL